MAYWGTAYWGQHQSIAMTTTSAATANNFNVGAYKARLTATAACFVAVGNSVTASTDSVLLPSGVIEYITIRPGQQVAALVASGTGTLHVTEVD